MTVGERIRGLRKSKGYSQAQLAFRLNMSRQAVAKWEKDICEPNLECLTAMANIFEVDLNYLITGQTAVAESTDGGLQGKETTAITVKSPLLDRKDIVILIALIVSIIVFMGLFIYAVLNPLYWNQRYSFIWWYIQFWVSSGAWFRVLAIASAIGIIVSLTLFLKRRITAEKKK